MFKLVALVLVPAMTMLATDLPSKKYLNMAAIKTMVAASEAKAKELNVGVTICIVDESGNLLFLEKGDGASLNTLQFAQKKARDAAAYGSPSREAAECGQERAMWKTWLFLTSFPTRAVCRFEVDGQVLGGIAASGAKSEIDEQIAQAGLDALLKN